MNIINHNTGRFHAQEKYLINRRHVDCQCRVKRVATDSKRLFHLTLKALDRYIYREFPEYIHFTQ